MLKNFNLFMLCFMILGVSFAQENYTISGTIKDASNGETIFGATVFLEGTTLGEMTNEYGFFSVSAPAGTYSVIISFLGYADIIKEVVLDKDTKLEIELSEASEQLDEVVVESATSERANIRSPQMSVTKVQASTIKKIPVVLGEVDLVKSIQLLPGITNGGEGTTGFNVRGGAVDQNLVLLDEAIIYNTAHLLGFFSVFNADAIKDMTLYKGNIPAKYGGRVSSVLDVHQKDGNNKEFAMTGGIGTISSRLAIEAPIVKNKGSFLIAGRSSYAHLFLDLAGEDNSASFYDLNLKANYTLNDNNRLFLSGYFGRDNANFSNSFENGYGNATGNLRWNHIFNDRLFSNASLIYSKYDYDLTLNLFDFEWESSIENINMKYDLKYYLNDKVKMDFGVSGINYVFEPGVIRPTTEDSAINFYELDQKLGFESSIYFNLEHKLTDKLTANYGLRYSNFNRRGAQTMTLYENDLPVVYNETLGIYEAGTAIGEEVYDKGETIENFGNFEPRVGLAYQLDENSSVKAGYSRAAQYIHLLSNTTSVTPLDVWTPSGKYVKPQLANQYSLGYFKNLPNTDYSFETEVYYKTVDNRIDYIDGSDLIGQNTIETEILNGESRSYGLELLLRKSKGNLTGWIAYTLSKTEQRTPSGAAGGPGINNGEWYNANYDRTHDLSITGSYKFNQKWTFGANFIFQTGRPVTYPNGQYEYEGIAVASYEDRNSDRLPTYHRIDLSATLVPNKRPDKRWKGEWVFGIYNVYNRKNAASISFEQNEGTGINEATRTTIFGIVPSVTYNFKF
ncbi:TonB-dependent receptor [Urechidicola sp. KH5]